ncbi:MAG: helix-turn-helix domain-containing protein [Cytophagales bacterium]|nr:helix-turn-helix domain-containing protein [Cytophagales bacterium]
MAERLGTSKFLLSQTIIYLCDQDNIFDLLNHHRVEQAQRLLRHPAHKHLKIEAIGQMAGFSSRSSFYAAFKAKTGLSPSAYKAQMHPYSANADT